MDAILAEPDAELVTDKDEPSASEPAPAKVGTKTGSAEAVDAPGPADADAASDAEGKPKPDGADKPKEEKATSAQFAALARKKQAVAAREEALERDRNEVSQRMERERTEVVRYAEQLRNAERALVQRTQEVDRVFSDKDSFFAAAEKAGITPEELAAWANGKDFSRKRAKALTQEDFTAQLRQERAQWQAEQTRQQQAWQRQTQTQQAESLFEQIISADENAYEASTLLLSRSERIAKANEFANEAAIRGLSWGLKEVAQAVEEYARADTRFAKFKARTAGTGAAPKIAAGNAGTRRPESRASLPISTNSQTRDSALTSSSDKPHRRKHEDRLNVALRNADRLGGS